MRRNAFNRLQRSFRRWFVRKPNADQSAAARVYVYLNGVHDDATIHRIQQTLSTLESVAPVARDARTGFTGLYCHPSQVIEVTLRIGSAGHSVAGVQFLGGHQSENQHALVTRHE